MIQHFYNNRFPAILCIVLAVFVMFVPVANHKNVKSAAIENASANESEKDIVLLRDGFPQSQKKVTKQTSSNGNSSYLLAGDELYQPALSSKKSHLPVHGSFIFLHMLKLF